MPGRKAPVRERREQILNAAMRVAATKRLSGLTIRAVARQAGLSTGLVLFHFRSRAALVHALLNWLLHENALLRPQAARRRRDDRLAGLIRAECTRLANSRRRTELFFDYWLTGTRQPALRRDMRNALRRYRQEFRALAVVALRGRRAGRGLTPDALAAAAVSFVQGCALQAVIDPERFDVTEALRVIDAIDTIGALRALAAARQRT